MAQTVTVSPNELVRASNFVYEGETLVVMLCSIGSTTLDETSTVLEWQAQEVATVGTGYVRFQEIIGTATYNSVDSYASFPIISAEFTSTSSYSFDRVVAYIDGSTTIHSVITENPNRIVVDGQFITYNITIKQF